MANYHGDDRRYARISDALRDELLRQALLYKVPVYVACRELGIKYATANNIVKLYTRAMEKGEKPIPRAKALDVLGSSTAIKNDLPSLTSIVAEIE